MLAFTNNLISLATIGAHLAIIITIIYLLLGDKNNWLIKNIGQHGLKIAFFIALISILASLFYSEILGFEPCLLCWWQRVFIYPQIILLGMAWYKKDYNIINYSLGLIFIGTLFALYHNYIDYGGANLLSCSSVETVVSCQKRYVFEYGYITIPLMSLTSFVLMTIFLYLQKWYNKIT